jgi:hypothetical protein
MGAKVCDWLSDLLGEGRATLPPELRQTLTTSLDVLAQSLIELLLQADPPQVAQARNHLDRAEMDSYV